MSRDNNLTELIHSASKNKELLEDFILGLTTPNERAVLLRRVEIIERLLAGESQHSIAADLGVGVSTVTRGSRELKLGRFKVLRDRK